MGLQGFLQALSWTWHTSRQAGRLFLRNVLGSPGALAAGGLAFVCHSVTALAAPASTRPEPCASGAGLSRAALCLLEVPEAKGAPSREKAESQLLPEKKSPFRQPYGCLS